MIWPPSKATSIRTRSSAATDDLREDAVDGVGVDERDLEPEEPFPGLVVDQLDAGLAETCQRRCDIVDLVRNDLSRVCRPGTGNRQDRHGDIDVSAAAARN